MLNNCNRYLEQRLEHGERYTLRERGSVLFIKAATNLEIYKVDNGIISKRIQGQNKCDYLMINTTELVSNFVELKGTDTEHACDQIHDTVVFFKQNQELREAVVDVNQVKGYIVSPNGNVPNINSVSRKKVCRELYQLSKKKLSTLFDHLVFIRCVKRVSAGYRPGVNSPVILVDNNHPLIV